MVLKSIDLLITFECPAKCSHCSYKAGPLRKGHMTAVDINLYLAESTIYHQIQSITIHGGEPFLYYDLMLHAVKRAEQLGISRVGVITNSFWAKTGEIAGSKLAALKKAGLTSITFSTDVFHQQYIPVEYVENAVLAAAQIKIDQIYVDSYYLENQNDPDNFNDQTDTLLKRLNRFRKLDNVIFNKYKVVFEGRAAELPERVINRELIPFGKCPLPFWMEGDFNNPETVEIDHEGNVTLCPGICIGNAKDNSLEEILKSHDLQKHPVLSLVAEHGPVGLYKLAKEHGLRFERGYVDECHLCYEMRRFLHIEFPRHLAPAACYQQTE
ncbi:MAG: radical SAM protein [Candidatus Hodarchaeales archaeon]